jgi:hypothetical protein
VRAVCRTGRARRVPHRPCAPCAAPAVRAVCRTRLTSTIVFSQEAALYAPPESRHHAPAVFGQQVFNQICRPRRQRPVGPLMRSPRTVEVRRKRFVDRKVHTSRWRTFRPPGPPYDGFRMDRLAIWDRHDWVFWVLWAEYYRPPYPRAILVELPPCAGSSSAARSVRSERCRTKLTATFPLRLSGSP